MTATVAQRQAMQPDIPTSRHLAHPVTAGTYRSLLPGADLPTADRRHRIRPPLTRTAPDTNKADRLLGEPTTLGEPYSRHLGGKLCELRFELDGEAVRSRIGSLPGSGSFC